MPSHIRIFFGIVAALVAYWIFSAGWRLAPTHPAHVINNTVITAMILATVFQCLIYLIPAWLAAFHRQNWARWAFAAIAVGVQLLPLWAALHLSGQFRQMVLQAYFHTSTTPRALAVDGLLIAAIIYVFTGNARAWFRPSITAAQP